MDDHCDTATLPVTVGFAQHAIPLNTTSQTTEATTEPITEPAPPPGEAAAYRRDLTHGAITLTFSPPSTGAPEAFRIGMSSLLQPELEISPPLSQPKHVLTAREDRRGDDDFLAFFQGKTFKPHFLIDFAELFADFSQKTSPFDPERYLARLTHWLDEDSYSRSRHAGTTSRSTTP